jgi:hypothetical protein
MDEVVAKAAAKGLWSSKLANQKYYRNSILASINTDPSVA